MVAVRSRHGASLALVLMIGAVVCVAAFALAAMAVQQVNLSHAFESDRAAQGLAEGLVAQAMAQLHADPTYGRYRTETLRTAPDPEDASRYATLTFNNTSGGPYCTNNWDGNSPVGYGDAEIPPGNTHMWVVGHSGGMVRGIEVMVSVPQSPFALETDGAFHFSGGLTVDGAPDLATALAIAGGATNLLPSSIGGDASISGLDACTISGNVDSPGTTDLPQGSVVGGTLRTDQVDVPSIDPTQYDPSGDAGAVPITASHLTNPPPFTQRCYTSNSLSISGNLVLANGLLYVPGDLVVSGSISGHGLVAVTGSVTVSGSTSLAGTVQETALVAGASVSLAGNYVGLAYSGGNLNASGGTLIGSFISSGAHSGINVTGVLAIYIPDTTSFLLRSLPQSQGMPNWIQQNGLLGDPDGFTLQLGATPAPDALDMLSVLNQQFSGKPFAPGMLPLNAPATVTPGDARLYHPLPAQQTSAVDLTTATALLRIPGMAIQRILLQTGPAFTWNGSSWQAAPNSGWSLNASGQWVYNNPMVTVNGQTPPNIPHLNSELNMYNHTTLAQMMNALYQAQQSVSQLLSSNGSNNNFNGANNQQQSPQQGSQWSYDMSLNQFVSNPSPLSITAWRDH